jgi:hypothetical protein
MTEQQPQPRASAPAVLAPHSANSAMVSGTEPLSSPIGHDSAQYDTLSPTQTAPTQGSDHHHAEGGYLEYFIRLGTCGVGGRAGVDFDLGPRENEQLDPSSANPAAYWEALPRENAVAGAVVHSWWELTGKRFHSGSMMIEDPHGAIFAFFRGCQVYERPSSHVLPGNLQQYGLETQPLLFECDGVSTNKTTLLFCQAVIGESTLLFVKPEEFGMSGWWSVLQHCVEYIRTRPAWRACCKCEGGAIKFRKERIPTVYVSKYRDRAGAAADAAAEADGVGAMLLSLCRIHHLSGNSLGEDLQIAVVREYMACIAADVEVKPEEEGNFLHRVGREQYVSFRTANKALSELAMRSVTNPGE